MTFPDSYCRHCGEKNHIVFFSPVFVEGMDARTGKRCEGQGVGTHICIPCATAAGYATSQGDLKQGVTL